jgi:phosphoglycerate kinase
VELPLLEDLPSPEGKSVLLRVDFNVPMTNGHIDDDLRIRAALPTIEWLLERGARVTACSHLGRPKGKPDEHYSMEPVRRRLAELAPGVELMENLRFDPGEEANDPSFVDRLVEGQDLYVDDAFGAAHRAHASVVGPPARLPCAAGRVLAREVEVLDGLLHGDAHHPFVAVLGGSKVSDKLATIQTLLEHVDAIIVGGGMCFTFLAAQGHSVGGSLLEEHQIENCRRLLAGGRRILIPSDITALSPGGAFGPGKAPTGEVRAFGVDRIDHMSTGGGASLEFIEQGDLPGLKALREGKHG